MMNQQANLPDQEEIETQEPESLEPSTKLTVVAAITASLERSSEDGNKNFKYSLGNLWNLSNKAALDFIDQIEKKFRRKNKFHSYFSGLPSNQTPENLKRYIKNEIDFSSLASAEMKLLSGIANDSERSTLVGGNIVFLHYKNTGDIDDDGRLMIVMVDNKGAFEFDEKTLEPKKLKPIDTDALRQAAMFDLTLFSEIYPERSGAAYLHFIEGRSKAEFFKTALGCDSNVSNKQSVNNLFEAIKQFSKSISLKAGAQQKITDKVYDHINKNIGKQISLSEIQHIIDKQLPDGHEAVGKFSSFANENGHQINAIFEATRQSLEKGISIQLSDYQSNYTVSVKAASIGYGNSDKPVTVDSDLTYMKIPLSPEDREKIKAAIGDSENDHGKVS